MKNLFFSVLCILISTKAISQKEANIWYFGNQLGLDFNSSPPSLLANGKITDAFGSAVIADDEGSLLFYTNGTTIWNKNHDTLWNGKNLSGQPQASQAALIVKDPASVALYYIFTTSYMTDGFQYSIVDMTLDGGLGGISLKNIPLLSSSTEKNTAALHANNMDIWILAHERSTDAFYTYLIDETGFSTTPVISHAGGVKSGTPAGHMKVSPQGTILAITVQDTIGLFNFDASTGIISEWISIQTFGTTNGIEFSPDGSKLFFTSIENFSAPNPINKVYQINLSAGSDADIKNSVQLIYSDTVADNSALRYITSLELGPDEKIYVLTSNEFYLDRIEQPNQSGSACEFIDSAFYLEGLITSYGLPNFAPIYTAKKILFQNSCSNDTTYFSITNTTNIDSVRWNFNDPGSTENHSVALTPVHTYSSAGTYEVTLSLHYANNTSRSIRQTIEVKQTPEVSLGNDTSICPGNVYTLTLTHPEYSYEWNDGSYNTSLAISQGGIYWVEAHREECKKRDSLLVSIYPIPRLLPEGTVELCYNDSLRIVASDSAAVYRWHDGSTLMHLSVFSGGNYHVEATTKCGSTTLTKSVSTISCCTPYIPNLLTANNDGLNEELVISCLEEGNWELELINRWGDRIFQSLDYRNDLKGSQLEEGLYYYSLSKKGKSPYKGWIQVIK